MRKNLPGIVLAIFILLLVIGFVCKTQFYQLQPRHELKDQQRELLISEASMALPASDVPIGAILLYGDSILSSGYNTVRRDSNIAGHAEINAVNNAIRKIGFDNFSQLDRDKLVLISTFEPCMMCANALMEFRIRRVLFMKSKSMRDWLKQDAREFRYELNKQKTTHSGDQDSLFRLHPGYRE